MPSLSVPNYRLLVNLAGCAVSFKAAYPRLKNYSWGAKMRQVGHGPKLIRFRPQLGSRRYLAGLLIMRPLPNVRVTLALSPLC